MSLWGRSTKTSRKRWKNVAKNIEGLWKRKESPKPGRFKRETFNLRRKLFLSQKKKKEIITSSSSAIKKLPYTLSTIGKSLMDQTGWNITILAGGPSPSNAGAIMSFLWAIIKNSGPMFTLILKKITHWKDQRWRNFRKVPGSTRIRPTYSGSFWEVFE